MNNKKNKITVGITAAILIFASLIAFSVVSVNHTADTNTWATVYITGTIDSDTFDSFDGTHEYLKGDHIVFGNVILDITDITRDGTVTFSVEQGDLYNEAGEAIHADSIVKGVWAEYKLNNGTVSLIVTSNRYR